MSKTCSTYVYGLISFHRWHRNNNSMYGKRVCSRCGLLQTMEVELGDYADFYWENKGIVDNPHALIEAWNQLKAIKKEPPVYHTLKWEDAI